jgi:Concanavalin A-like lectin/glucanases superfamily
MASLAVTTAFVGLGASSAQARTVYECALASASKPCSSPLSGVKKGAVSVEGGGFRFSGERGYVQVDHSSRIDTTHFPVKLSVQVKGIGVPSKAVHDYDLIRGTKGGGWRVEVVARDDRTTARAACFFAGEKGKDFAVGGRDLKKVQSTWTKITCVNTGSSIRLFVNGNRVQTVGVTTGRIGNPGGLLLGAKDTSGGDQTKGYVRNVEITVP